MVKIPWEETDQYIRSEHRNPEDFEQNSFRTITLSEDEGIKAIIGKLKGKEKQLCRATFLTRLKAGLLRRLRLGLKSTVKP
ncbi:MAG: hypothetical protein QXK93_08465 [Candidatus Bathyarchaeia archaeon]